MRRRDHHHIDPSEAVGGARGLSHVAPGDLDGLPHFTLLRVDSTAPTPLSREVKADVARTARVDAELDIWTQGELRWERHMCRSRDYLPLIQTSPARLRFRGCQQYRSAHRYKVYAQNESLLDLIVNSVRETNRFTMKTTSHGMPTPILGSHCRQSMSGINGRLPGIPCAMLENPAGQSNVVKIIAQSLIETTRGAQRWPFHLRHQWRVC